MNFKKFRSKYEKKEVVEIPSNTPIEPLVSICIQTYQHKKYLQKCLDSVIKQKTDFSFEILLGEDNSSDGTREICLEYAKKFPDKIKLFLHNRENQIPVMEEATSNFNAFYNLFSAKGKYIAFCEGDDYWNDTQKLQKQINFLEKDSSFIFTYHAYDEVDENGNNLDSFSVLQPKIDIKNEELKKGIYHPLLLTVCFRNCIREIPEQILEVINVDTFLFSLLGKYGGGKFLKDINPAGYRKHLGGVWGKRLQKLKFQSKIRTYGKLKEYYTIEDDREIANFYKNKLRNIYKALILLEIKEGNFKEAIQTLRNYLKYKLL